MCNNYRLSIRDDDAEAYNLFGHLSRSKWTNPEPRKAGFTDIYPGYEGCVVHRGSTVLAYYRWGFDNFIDPKRLLVNARGDSVHEKRTYAKAFRETRCLILADGYYEYRQSDPVGKKRRYLFEAGGLFAFAGLWQERGGIRSYTMITTEPNDVVNEIHDRMPVLLAKADFERWLDPDSDEEQLLSLLTPWIGKLTVTETPKAQKPKKEEDAAESAPKKKTPSKPKGKTEGKDLFE